MFFLLWPSFLRGFGSDCLAGRSILPRRSEDHLWRCQTPGQSYVDTFIHVNTYIPWASMGIHGPQQPTFLEVLMENNLVFRWPKPLFLMALGAHGNYLLHRLKIHTDLPAGPTDGPTWCGRHTELLLAWMHRCVYFAIISSSRIREASSSNTNLIRSPGDNVTSQPLNKPRVSRFFVC